MLSRRRIYFALVAVRLLLLLAPGYVHPDGFFQSPEVVADHMLSLKAFVPWEFADVHNPCRSIVPPLLVSGVAYIPVWLASSLIPQRVLPLLLLALPRLIMFVLSLLVDYCVYAVYFAMGGGGDGLGPLLAAALCWPMVVLQQRPFSNSVESVLVALSLLLYVRTYEWAAASHISAAAASARTRFELAIGAVAALGVFTRFTFLFYFFPIALHLLFDIVRAARFGHRAAAARSFGTQLASFVCTSAVIVLVDSLYFGSAQLTPLNSLRYNMDPANLALHGVHARYTHLLVYAPMLFGPNALLAAAAAAAIAAQWAGARSLLGPLVRLFPSCTQWLHARTARLVALVPLSGIAFLSTAPHQEARFLLPCLAPIALLSGDIAWGSRWRRATHKAEAESRGSATESGVHPPHSHVPRDVAWRRGCGPVGERLLVWWILACVVFHVALALFWGVVHQGGVVQAALVLGGQHRAHEAGPQQPATWMPGSGDPSDTLRISTLMFFCTYMPPRHLFAIPKESSLEVVDAHCDADSASAVLDAELPPQAPGDAQSNDSVQGVLVVAPSAVLRDRLDPLLRAGHQHLEWQPVRSFAPSFSGEHLAGNVAALRFEAVLVYRAP